MIESGRFIFLPKRQYYGKKEEHQKNKVQKIFFSKRSKQIQFGKNKICSKNDV